MRNPSYSRWRDGSYHVRRRSVLWSLICALALEPWEPQGQASSLLLPELMHVVLEQSESKKKAWREGSNGRTR